MGDKMRVGAGSRPQGIEGGTLGGLLTSVSEAFTTSPSLWARSALRGRAHRVAHPSKKSAKKAPLIMYGPLTVHPYIFSGAFSLLDVPHDAPGRRGGSTGGAASRMPQRHW